jgi:predicted flap endonuclease-1-like 5' DNA nuclease
MPGRWRDPSRARQLPSSAEPHDVNGLSLLALILAAVAIVAAYRIGRMHGRRDGPPPGPLPAPSPTAPREVAQPVPASAPVAPVMPRAPAEDATIAAEKTRLVIAYEAEGAALRTELTGARAEIGQLNAFAEDRRRLFGELATARADSARYRQVVVDLENDAPPPILGERGTPDDLKLIVGIGPVLERMLQQMGIATYRQIARWSERDIDEMDARLPEFPGRIRRDTWVTQARALHQSKYGERA